MFVQLILVGNVGRDPELRYTTSGQAVCDFSLATNESWFDKESGERKNTTTWWKVTVWGKQAETINQYVSKGKKVLVRSDSVKASAYIGRDGDARASLEITARDVKFLSERASDGSGERSEDESEDIPF